MPRMLSEATCQIRATELIECMKMWDIGKADAYRITVIMKSLAQNTDNKDWVNPLTGAGLKIAPADDGELTTEQELFIRRNKPN